MAFFKNCTFVSDMISFSLAVWLKAAVHWVRVNALSAESSRNLTWSAMGLRAASARRLSVRAEPLTR